MQPQKSVYHIVSFNFLGLVNDAISKEVRIAEGFECSTFLTSVNAGKKQNRMEHHLLLRPLSYAKLVEIARYMIGR